MSRPINGESSYTRSDLRRLMQMMPLAIILMVGGHWFAQRASSSPAENALYWHTVLWFEPGELIATSKFNFALSRAKTDKNQLALAESIESEVLPFWREAAARTAAIHLPAGSLLAPNLEFLQSVAQGRVTGLELLAEAMQTNDPKVAAAAQREMQRVDGLIRDRRAAPSPTF
jgi:hypothetical protein